jgi:hypothetical protein
MAKKDRRMLAEFAATNRRKHEHPHQASRPGLLNPILLLILIPRIEHLETPVLARRQLQIKPRIRLRHIRDKRVGRIVLAPARIRKMQLPNIL